jgi:hypothetical protein
MLPSVVFDDMETCSRYMKELGDDFRFYKDTNQRPYPSDWHMTCKHFWETDADYQKFLESINGKKEPECIMFGDGCL